MTRYFEDFAPGQVFELGSRGITREEIVEYAREWDPQSFHVDEAAAERSPYGGLIASGLHTLVIYMRLLVDGLLRDAAGHGSPGVDELRWLRPVRPGDTLSARATVLETRPSSRRPDRGTVLVACELSNQDGEVVLSMRVPELIGRRPG